MKKWVWRKLTEEEMIERGKETKRLFVELKQKIAAMTAEEREEYYSNIDDSCCLATPHDEELVEIDFDEK